MVHKLELTEPERLALRCALREIEADWGEPLKDVYDEPGFDADTHEQGLYNAALTSAICKIAVLKPEGR